MTNPSSYNQRGVSSSKEDVHNALKGVDKGLFPKAFCRIIPDFTGGDEDYCSIMHADGAGTKSSLAYIYWKETGNLSVWKGIAQDAIVMNTDDLLCAGATDNFLISSTIDRAPGLSRRFRTACDGLGKRRHRSARGVPPQDANRSRRRTSVASRERLAARSAAEFLVCLCFAQTPALVLPVDRSRDALARCAVVAEPSWRDCLRGFRRCLAGRAAALGRRAAPPARCAILFSLRTGRALARPLQGDRSTLYGWIPW